MRRAVFHPLGEGKLQASRSESLVRARAASIGAPPTDRAGLPSSLLPVMTRSVEATATATATAVPTGSSLIPLQQSAVSLQAMHS